MQCNWTWLEFERKKTCGWRLLHADLTVLRVPRYSTQPLQSIYSLQWLDYTFMCAAFFAATFFVKILWFAGSTLTTKRRKMPIFHPGNIQKCSKLRPINFGKECCLSSVSNATTQLIVSAVFFYNVLSFVKYTLVALHIQHISVNHDSWSSSSKTTKKS